MEFWEGAILIVGGVWLVSHMAQKNSQPRPLSTVQPGIGVTNQSDLTNITNQAGGMPTVYGEPLEPLKPPLVWHIPGLVPVSPTPVKTPILGANPPRSIRGFRPL